MKKARMMKNERRNDVGEREHDVGEGSGAAQDAVEGRPWAYETAISHVDYNNGDWIAVASAETAEEAAASHEDYLINHLSDRDRAFEDIYSGKVFSRAD